MLSAESPRWNNSSPAPNSTRSPSASTRAASSGARPLRRSMSVMAASVHKCGYGAAMQQQSAGRGKKALRSRVFLADVVFDLEQQGFDRNAGMRRHGEHR